MEFEKEPGLEEEPRDRTKLVWIGIALGFIVMGFALWSMRGLKSDISLVRARHILIRYDRNDAIDRGNALIVIKSLKEQIDNGASFAKLAREYSSDDTSARRGGDLGYKRKGEFVQAFEEYVWSGEIGVVSDVVATNLGFHLIKIEDRQLSEIDRVELERKRRVQGGAPGSP